MAGRKKQAPPQDFDAPHDSPPIINMTTSHARLNLPLLSENFTSEDLIVWLGMCEEAFESYEEKLGEDYPVKSKIREAGLKLNGKARSWYYHNRLTLKNSTSWEDFSSQLKNQFISATERLEAEHELFTITQNHSSSFNDYVKTLEDARTRIGTSSDGSPAIDDKLFKLLILHHSDPLLYIRATSTPNFTLDTFTVDSLTGHLATLWSSITLESSFRKMSTRPSTATLARTPAEREAFKKEGRCFVCGKAGHRLTECPEAKSVTPSISSTTAQPSQSDLAKARPMVAALRTITQNRTIRLSPHSSDDDISDDDFKIEVGDDLPDEDEE